MKEWQSYAKKCNELAGICDNLEGQLAKCKDPFEAQIMRNKVKRATQNFNKVMKDWQTFNNGGQR